MSKHTPGPWFYIPKVEARYDPFTGTRRPDQGAHWIGVDPENTKSVALLIGEENLEANAALIIASPDLLQELKRVRDLTHQECGNCSMCNVINKAEGKK